MNARCPLFLFLMMISIPALAQDPNRFLEEIESLRTKNFQPDANKAIVVFTGSSSIRMWNNVQENFPEINAINTGFGGSHFTDLIHFANDLIFKYNPDKIFIYEGDNDIADGKSPAQILAAAAFLYAQIRQRLPEAQVYFITPKPSIARWELKENYEVYISLLKDFTQFDDSIHFVDTWSAMLDENGVVLQDIFVSDNLHMNEKGYKIWAEVIGKYLNDD
jgi:lysophospholipase L1-like esterase